MFACDFVYDGHYLSDYGFEICRFGGDSDSELVSAGSVITFQTVPTHHGKKYNVTGTQYDECITSTFQICKNPSLFDDMRITSDEYTEMMRWLNRREFLKFQIFSDSDFGDNVRYYDASFNVGKVMVSGELYGLELTMETDRPFGYGATKTITLSATKANQVFTVLDESDEIGYTYPDMTITCKQNGNLTLKCDLGNCLTEIKGVAEGETITIKGEAQIITASGGTHDIGDSFNYEFFRIGNTFQNRVNKVTVSLPCTVVMRYAPVIKNSPE